MPEAKKCGLLGKTSFFKNIMKKKKLKKRIKALESEVYQHCLEISSLQFEVESKMKRLQDWYIKETDEVRQFFYDQLESYKKETDNKNTKMVDYIKSKCT